MSTAIITGGAVRIGKALALHLASIGFNIALHYHSSGKEALKAIQEIKSLGVKAKAYSLDFTMLEKIPKLIKNIHNDFPDTNLLINSASDFLKGEIKQTSNKKLLSNMQVNLLAPFILMREYQKEIASGHIINILDQSINKGLPKHAAYSVSKAALSHLTTLAVSEYAPKIRVNALALGLILPKAGQDEHFFKQQKKQITLQKTETIEALLKGLDYLINNSSVSGKILSIEGIEAKTRS